MRPKSYTLTTSYERRMHRLKWTGRSGWHGWAMARSGWHGWAMARGEEVFVAFVQDDEVFVEEAVSGIIADATADASLRNFDHGAECLATVAASACECADSVRELAKELDRMNQPHRTDWLALREPNATE